MEYINELLRKGFFINLGTGAAGVKFINGKVYTAHQTSVQAQMSKMESAYSWMDAKKGTYHKKMMEYKQARELKAKSKEAAMNPDDDIAFNSRDDITTTTVHQKDVSSMVSTHADSVTIVGPAYQPPRSECTGLLDSGEYSFLNDDDHNKDGNSGGEE